MKVWQFIKSKYELGTPVMLLYVLESRGSSPGRQGFHMAVSKDGEMCGSIGGGIMEHKFVELAKARLMDGIESNNLYKQIHDKTAGQHQSGMICSGEQTIFLQQVNQKDLAEINKLLSSLKAGHNGTLCLSETGITFSAEIPVDDFVFTQSDEQHFTLVEKTGFKNQLHIIGGGHCSLAFSKLMSGMDFHITVYEERMGLNTLLQNTSAHKKVILENYSELSSLITGGNQVYVVIMTVGYRTDDIALRSLLNQSFRYIGLLGSRKKIEKLFAAFEDSEADTNSLQAIHSPIGLPIKSQTPEEIAVSIAAEIIAEKNRYQ